MPNLPEGHPILLRLEECFEAVREALISGSQQQKRDAMTAYAHAQRYAYEASEVLIANVEATQSPTNLSLFEETEPAPEPEVEATVPDMTAAAISR